MLRKDSLLRVLFFNDTKGGNHPGIERDDDGNVLISFSYFTGEKLAESPADLAAAFKKRYGCDITGKLFYKGVYLTFRQEFQLEADLG